MKPIRFCMTRILLALLAVALTGCESTRLSKSTYIDKCKGAWAGQMVGVCYADLYEFKSNGKPITMPLRPWKPSRVEGAIAQDDCYVEMTFLKSLEDYGLDITYEQAGKDFGDSKYKLWHANKYGRANIRKGIMPPMSGHPKYNQHADDIDFQIEADLLGIICPGLPNECNRLCDIFGHIMNYGDGVYGGMFVAGMYTGAYFEDTDVRKVIQHGLACIPSESQYYKCISDVVRWHSANPTDWLASWHKIEAKWQDNVDCTPKKPYNIDAKLNGAYIVMGLLYGQGNPWRTMEIATRCGQDADCNSSSALGILGCMTGYARLDTSLTSGIPAIAVKNFSYTNYSFNTLIDACQRMAEKIIIRAGGQVTDTAYCIPAQKPTPPAKLEQWSDADQMKVLSAAKTLKED